MAGLERIYGHFADSGASKFISQINGFAVRALVRAFGAQGALLEIARRLIDRSPVGPEESGHAGRFKGNWVVTANVPANSYDATLTDPNGLVTLGLAFDSLEQIDFSQDWDVWFCNHTPYAVRLEYGWSNQAPTGMVRITAREFTEIIREIFIQGGGGFNTPDTF